MPGLATSLSRETNLANPVPHLLHSSLEDDQSPQGDSKSASSDPITMARVASSRLYQEARDAVGRINNAAQRASAPQPAAPAHGAGGAPATALDSASASASAPRSLVFALKPGKGHNVAPSCRVVIDMGGSSFEACIDTGAARTMLSRQAFDSFRGAMGSPSPSTDRFFGASGEDLKILGVLKDVTFTLSSVPCAHDFIVCDHLAVDVLLGMDFLTANEVIIDLARGELTLKGELASRSAAPGQFLVMTDKRVTLQSDQETAVPVRIAGWPSDEAYVVFEPSISLGAAGSPGVQLLRQSNGIAYLAIANRGSASRTLAAGQFVGTAHLVARQHTEQRSGDSCYAVFEYGDSMPLTHGSSPSRRDVVPPETGLLQAPCFLPRDDAGLGGGRGVGARSEGRASVGAPQAPPSRDQPATGTCGSARILGVDGRVLPSGADARQVNSGLVAVATTSPDPRAPPP